MLSGCRRDPTDRHTVCKLLLDPVRSKRSSSSKNVRAIALKPCGVISSMVKPSVRTADSIPLSLIALVRLRSFRNTFMKLPVMGSARSKTSIACLLMARCDFDPSSSWLQYLQPTLSLVDLFSLHLAYLAWPVEQKRGHPSAALTTGPSSYYWTSFRRRPTPAGSVIAALCFTFLFFEAPLRSAVGSLSARRLAIASRHIKLASWRAPSAISIVPSSPLRKAEITSTAIISLIGLNPMERWRSCVRIRS